MTNNPSKPHARRRIRIVAPVLLAITVALLVWMVLTVWATFVPVSELELSSTTAGENTDITSIFTVPSGNVNFESTIEYTPPEWFVATDADVPDGTQVGTLSSQATLGYAFGGQDTCNQSLAPTFTLYDATTEGAAFTDTGDMIAGDWNGYDPDCAGQGNGDKAICEYPNFLDVLYPVRPMARYYGHAIIGGGLEAALNFLVFEPGTNLPGGPSSQTAAWGYPSVTVLNNTGAAWGDTVPSALGDFCTPLVSDNTVVGEAGGVAIRTNPDCSGTFTFRSWALGQPDADGDGLENGFDTCPYDPNPEFNPRVAGPVGDTDMDALANVCDPAPTTAKGDQDDDGYVNAADNCPKVANGCTTNLPACVGIFNPAWDNQADADNDGIGDACDTDGVAPKPEVLNEELISITGAPACSAAGTGTATATATATATGTATGTATATGTPEGTGTPTATTVAGEGCAPVIPGTYNGLVRLNGVPAPAGYEVTATIDGTEWGSTIVSGGRYALDVPQKLPSAEPCFAGGTITFTIDGGTCEPTEEWASGLHDVDLSCAPAATPTVVPPSTPVVTPPPPTTPVVTPAKPPTTGSGGLGGDQGLPLWAMLLAGWAGLTALAGLGTVATRIIKR